MFAGLIPMNNYFENHAYRQAFFEDTDRIMDGFRNDFAHLSAGADNQDLLKNIRRYAHSLKGLFAMMEFEDYQQIAMHLELVLAQWLQADAARLDQTKLSEIKNGFDQIEVALQQLKTMAAASPPGEA